LRQVTVRTARLALEHAATPIRGSCVEASRRRRWSGEAELILQVSDSRPANPFTDRSFHTLDNVFIVLLDKLPPARYLSGQEAF
jgi:hypothetical protein